MKLTYSMNKFFQMSSDLQKAYRNLHVDPSKHNWLGSRYSKKMAITSSGNSWKGPIAALAFEEAVYKFPAGFTAKGWWGIVRGDSSKDPDAASCDSRSAPPLGWRASFVSKTPPTSAGITEDFMVPKTGSCVTVCLSISDEKKIGGERLALRRWRYGGERCTDLKVNWPI